MGFWNGMQRVFIGWQRDNNYSRPPSLFIQLSGDGVTGFLNPGSFVTVVWQIVETTFPSSF